MVCKIFVLLFAAICTIAVAAPTSKKMCYNLACADSAAICYYSAETSENGRQILETTMCLDSAENVLQKETKRRSNVVGSEFSTKHVLPFKNQNWIGSGDVPKTVKEVILKTDSVPEEAPAEN